MNITESKACAEADAAFDLKLSELYRWEKALGVPAAHLLREPDAGLSTAVAFRGRLLRAMRTVRSIQERIEDDEGRILSTLLAQQLTELMPELTHVSAWPAVGNPRSSDELGAIVDKRLPDDFFEAARDS